MQMIRLSDQQERNAFALKAATWFTNHPEHYTFGDLEPGSWFGMRFGVGEDCVVVFRIGDEEPVNYQQLIRKE